MSTIRSIELSIMSLPSSLGMPFICIMYNDSQISLGTATLSSCESKPCPSADIQTRCHTGTGHSTRRPKASKSRRCLTTRKALEETGRVKLTGSTDRAWKTGRMLDSR
ncbi:hypothetical protein ACGC1H_006641 [Rhizoctonia solani]